MVRDPRAAELRQRLLDYCDQETSEALHAGDRYGDRTCVRRGLYAAKHVIETAEVGRPLREYIEEIARTLGSLQGESAVRHEDHPDHWCASGVRAILSRLETLAGALGFPMIENWVVPDDLLRLIAWEMPLARYLHARGSLSPFAAVMDLDGTITGESFTSDKPEEIGSPAVAIDHFRTKYEREIWEEGTARAGVVCFHGFMSDDEVHVAHYHDEASALVVWLVHGAGGWAQAVIPYSVSRGTEVDDVVYSAPGFSWMRAR